MKFHSRKDSLFTVIFVGFIVLMLYFVLLAFRESTNVTGQLVVVLSTMLVIVLFLWIYLGTYYDINRDVLIYHSGPLKGSIPIS